LKNPKNKNSIDILFEPKFYKLFAHKSNMFLCTANILAIPTENYGHLNPQNCPLPMGDLDPI